MSPSKVHCVIYQVLDCSTPPSPKVLKKLQKVRWPSRTKHKFSQYGLVFGTLSALNISVSDPSMCCLTATDREQIQTNLANATLPLALWDAHNWSYSVLIFNVVRAGITFPWNICTANIHCTLSRFLYLEWQGCGAICFSTRNTHSYSCMCTHAWLTMKIIFHQALFLRCTWKAGQLCWWEDADLFWQHGIQPSSFSDSSL